MGPFEMVVYIVLIGVAGGVIGKMIAARHGGEDDTGNNGNHPRRRGHAWGSPNNSQEDLKPYLEKIDALEERIRVLERIVTDKSERLSREIDDL